LFTESHRIFGWTFLADLKTHVVLHALECELLLRHRLVSHTEARITVFRFTERFRPVGLPLTTPKRDDIKGSDSTDDSLAPTWDRFITVSGAAAGRRAQLRFREELHAIEAVMAGQGVAILSDLLLKRELAAGEAVIVSPVSLDGFGLYAVRRPGNRDVPGFIKWLKVAFGG
jgi:DNA-binding transcriptional LysR family regulator